MKEYINPKEIEIPVVICSHTVQTWLYKLGFVYKKMRKNVIVDGHEKADMIEDQNYFLTKIEKLKPYIVEFNEDNAIKAKNYPVHYAVGGEKRNLIIVITYDDCIFSATNGVQKAWT